MTLKCLHGYFMFRESKAGDMSDFMALIGMDLVQQDDYFTFEKLVDAPLYSIAGGEYLGATATVTYEGKPWEVMRENELVYDFINDEVVPIASISQRIDLIPTLNYFRSSGLILPGSVTDGGSRVTDYAAWFLFDQSIFRYSQVSDV